MSLVLDQNKLIGTSLSALAIIAGVNLKNSVKFLVKDGQPVGEGLKTLSTVLGMLLFAGGWAGIAYNTVGANSDTGMVNRSLIVLAVVGILGAVILQNFANEPMPVAMAVGFIGGWLLLGVTAGLGSGTSMALTLSAALLVLASMTTILPLQRGDEAMGMKWTSPDAKIVDGPGYPMFVIAWGLLALSNAMA